jgi:hypothetical protein
MASALNLDMHGIGEAIAGVVAGGNLNHRPLSSRTGQLRTGKKHQRK